MAASASPVRPIDRSSVEETDLSKEVAVLSNGVKMPMLGLGTWQLKDDDCVTAVTESLRLGYRHIDTAMIYGNEEQVREGIARSGVPREKIFITSKLWPGDHGEEKAVAAFEASLARLGTDYLDLYLIHWPGARGVSASSPDSRELRAGSWRALERLYREGRVRAIGVSNYMRDHIEELVRSPGLATVPHVNQFELHPLLPQRDAQAASREHGILVEGYSSLARGDARLFDDARVRAVAAAHHKTVAQVLLRWSVQQGIPVLPKSARVERLRENAALFDFALSEEEMALLSGFDLGDDGRTCWNPTKVE